MSKKVDPKEVYSIKKQMELDLEEKINEYNQLEDKIEKDWLKTQIIGYKIQINHLSQLLKKPEKTFWNVRSKKT